MKISTPIQKYRRTFKRYARKVIEPGRDMIRVHRTDVYVHPMNGIHVPASFIPDIKHTPSDVEFAERLLRSYSLATTDNPEPINGGAEDLWTYIAQKQQSTFFEILNGNNANRLASYLCNMSRHDATCGTVQGIDEFDHLKRSVHYQRFVARMAKDKLISLAEAVGAIPCENPEQGQWGENSRISERTLVEKIEQTIGISIAPPAIDGGLFKIGEGDHRLSERDCNAIYTAWLVRGILPKNTNVSVCEIGGGVGRLALWSTILGCTNYTLIDLPHMNVLQGFYLLKALPDAKVSLYGEDHQNDGGGLHVQVMPPFARSQLSRNSFDLVINQDSFPEIHPSIVCDYLVWIKLSTKLFLSINHESKPKSINGTLLNNVHELVTNVGGFVRRTRQPYWPRKGYVCELYDIVG